MRSTIVQKQLNISTLCYHGGISALENFHEMAMVIHDFFFCIVLCRKLFMCLMVLMTFQPQSICGCHCHHCSHTVALMFSLWHLSPLAGMTTNNRNGNNNHTNSTCQIKQGKANNIMRNNAVRDAQRAMPLILFFNKYLFLNH